MVEAWLRGPLEGFPPVVMPAAFALVQSREEMESVTAGLSRAQLWASPGGAASIGYHLRHLAGSTDRLLTYARGESLNETQRAALAAEREQGTPPATAAELIDGAVRAIDHALEMLRGTPRDALFEPRTVGRKQLPTTVWGLLFHIAEHTQRHAGALIATARVVHRVA